MRLQPAAASRGDFVAGITHTSSGVDRLQDACIAELMLVESSLLSRLALDCALIDNLMLASLMWLLVVRIHCLLLK